MAEFVAALVDLRAIDGPSLDRDRLKRSETKAQRSPISLAAPRSTVSLGYLRPASLLHSIVSGS